MERLENWGLDSFRKEWILVWGLEAANEGVKFFTLAQQPIKETQFGIWDVDGTRLIDGTIEGKLHSLNQVKDDRIL